MKVFLFLYNTTTEHTLAVLTMEIIYFKNNYMQTECNVFRHLIACYLQLNENVL